MKKLLLLGAVICAVTASAQTVPQVTASGQVYTTVRSGNTVYIGGNFTKVGPSSPNGTLVDTATGAASYNLPFPNNTVSCVIPDGRGGFYISGGFTMVGDQPRNRIAQIGADGTLQPFNPGANGAVSAMLLLNGKLYVAGGFSAAGGQNRNRIAVLDTATGQATAFNPGLNASITLIYSLLQSNGKLYVSGIFSNMAGLARGNIIALDTATGSAISTFNANCVGAVNKTLIIGDKLYLGGSMTSVGGQARGQLASVDTATGAVSSFNPNLTGGYVANMVASGNKLFVGGNILTAGGVTTNSYMIAINALTGAQITAFAPQVNSTVTALALMGNRIYIGGLFSSAGGQTRSCAAALDTATGAATPGFNPSPSSTIQTFMPLGDKLYMGGTYGIANGVTRNNIAALNATTGELLPNFNPNANALVYSLVMQGNRLYVGGGFTTIGGLTRNRLAALDTSNGSAITAFNSDINSAVYAIAATGSRLFVTGPFTTINSTARGGLAAVNITTGALITTFAADITGGSAAASTLTIVGKKLYMGGNFTSVGGQTRNRIAAVDTATGTLASFNPNANNIVSAFVPYGNKIYVGGSFNNIGGQSRARIALLDTATGNALTGFEPAAFDGVVNAMTLTGKYLYAGGTFTTVGTDTRNGLAALDTATAAVVPGYAPVFLNGAVTSLSSSGDTLYAGGLFTSFNNKSIVYYTPLAAVTDATPLPVTLQRFSAARIDKKVMVSWTTAAEQQTAYFDVERSSDGRAFHTLGTVAANNHPAQYDFEDIAPLPSTAYYRLAIHEQNGNVNYSSIIAVHGLNAAGSITVAPNPAISSLTITNTNEQLNGRTAVITDALGNTHHRIVLSSVTQINVSSWKAGMYILRFPDGSVTRIIKQ